MHYRAVETTDEYVARLETGADWRAEIEALAADVGADAGWFTAAPHHPQFEALSLLSAWVSTAGSLTTGWSIRTVVPHDDLAPYICSCDATYGVVDASNPSNPIKVYEYLACERPVITSATDELGFVAERDLGVALDRVSPETVADAIARLRSLDDDALAEMGRRGREYVVENHTWDRLADAVVATYRE